MPTRTDINRLVAELQMEAELISELQGKNEKAKSRIDKGAQDELDWAALHYFFDSHKKYIKKLMEIRENIEE